MIRRLIILLLIVGCGTEPEVVCAVGPQLTEEQKSLEWTTSKLTIYVI